MSYQDTDTKGCLPSGEPDAEQVTRPPGAREIQGAYICNSLVPVINGLPYIYIYIYANIFFHSFFYFFLFFLPELTEFLSLVLGLSKISAFPHVSCLVIPAMSVAPEFPWPGFSLSPLVFFFSNLSTGLVYCIYLFRTKTEIICLGFFNTEHSVSLMIDGP